MVRRRDELPPELSEEETAPNPAARLGLIVGVVVLLLGLLGGAIYGVVQLGSRFGGGDDDVALAPTPPLDPGPVVPTPVGPTTPNGTSNPNDVDPNPGDPTAAAAAMGARYRPGPYVDVVGMLPSGLARLRRMAPTNRGGRTVDNPWIVAGGELRPGAAPSTTGPGLGLRISNTSTERLVVIPGAPARLSLFATGSDISGLLVRFVDYPGYFYVPSVVDTELGTLRVTGDGAVELQFGIDSPMLPSGLRLEPGKDLFASIEIAAVDTQGRTSAWARRDLRVLPVGTGDLEVTLSMTRATDLDLYVVDPSGLVTYYGNTRTGSGGQLDLDANAGCSGNMGVDHEHIFFPRGAAPAGSYQVRVSNFESCISGERVDYRITVRNCGETAIFSGSFEGQGNSRTCTVDPGSERNWCQQVVTFEVTPCTPTP
ncbi:MAG: hypothetical protein H6720_14560 [Sandaracinus sp.]|nr:hypothetical protein [Sandaracinus sp.]